MTDSKREERLRRAREKLGKLKAASKTEVRADRMDWRPKALIWLHPDTDIVNRRRVWFSKEVEAREEGEGKKKKKKRGRTGGKRVVSIPFVVPEDPECDPFYLLRKALKEREDIDGEDVVLSVGSGSGKVEYRKGDVLGWDDFTFKRRLTPQQDFVCAAILAEDAKGDRPKPLKCSIFSGAKTLGREITKEIEAEIDENGEEKGSPFLRPYPFRIEYDETATGTDMYSARARPAVDPDAELEKLFDADAPSLEEETKVSDPKVVYAMLKDALVVDLEIPEPKGAGSEAAADEVEERPKVKRKPDPEPEPEPEDEPEDEPEPKPKKAEEKPKPEPKPKPKKAEEKPKTTRRKKTLAPEPEPKTEIEDDVEVPAGYEDPGPRPDDPNVGWWPDRAKGELYDVCPKCDRPVREDDVKCPHKDCGVSYAPADGAF